MKCRNCGSRIKADTGYCMACGWVIDTPPRISTTAKVITASIIVLLVAGIGFVLGFGYPVSRYEKGIKAFDSQEYEEAKQYFEEAGDYKDAADRAKQASGMAYFTKGKNLYEQGRYTEAVEALEQATDYELTDEYLNSSYYYMAVEDVEKGYYDEAVLFFQKSDYWEDSCEYLMVICGRYVDNKQYESAKKVFEDFDDTRYQYYVQGIIAFDQKEFYDAHTFFSYAAGLFDAGEMDKKSMYNYGVTLLNDGNYNGARDIYVQLGDYSDSYKMLDVCDMMDANNKIRVDGDLVAAQNILNGLPYDCSFGNVSVEGLMNILSANKDWVNLCGIWTGGSGHMETVGENDNGWYRDTQDGNFRMHPLKIKCAINDGYYTIHVEAEMDIYDNFSNTRDNLRQHTESITKDMTIKELGTYRLNDYTTIEFAKTGITLDYHQDDGYQNGYHYYRITKITYRQ